jgi:PiT family inorganic phosphate transporter
LISAIIWNLFSWYLALPSSSSHALIGALVGAAIQGSGMAVLNLGGLAKIIGSLLTSPVLGIVIGFAFMVALFWIFRRQSLSAVNGKFRYLQIASAAFMAFSHGSNDAQKTMGVITLALVTTGVQSSFHVPTWVILLSAVAMAAGTAIGGWNIIKTIGLRLVTLQPVNGFAAETAAAAIIQMATHVGLPVSTTHVISTSIMGVGASKRFSAVRWGVAGNIVLAWVFTLPVTAALGWIIRFGFSVFGIS